VRGAVRGRGENQHKLNDVTESVDQRSNGASRPFYFPEKKNPKQTHRRSTSTGSTLYSLEKSRVHVRSARLVNRQNQIYQIHALHVHVHVHVR